MINPFDRTHDRRIRRFRPKFPIDVDVGPYRLKTVAGPEELRASLEMRDRPDVDEDDLRCDHLILLNRKTGRLIATSLLNGSLFSNDFLSARGFDLSRILADPGPKLEWGRAFVHRDFRDGLAVPLLWRGISEYAAKTGARIVFGCARVKTDDPRAAALLHRHFAEEARLETAMPAPPARAASMPGLAPWIRGFDGPLTESEKQEAKELLPPLCRASLGAGARIGGEPAYEAESKSIDFLTILRREDLNRSLWKRPELEPGESFAS